MTSERPAPAPIVVLVVEDESPIRKFLRAGLEGHSYSLFEATTGRDGDAASREFDLLVAKAQL